MKPFKCSLLQLAKDGHSKAIGTGIQKVDCHPQSQRQAN